MKSSGQRTLIQGAAALFEPDRERGLRTHTAADAAVLLAGNRLVQAQGIAPKSLGTEGIEAKHPPALCDRALRVFVDLTINARQPRFRFLRFGVSIILGPPSDHERDGPEQN